ncbi:MAG: M13 family metallopeptidase [Nitrosomonas sp.]|nr:M13 family metallopeptidase [Nitrosomonas sp.]
MLIVGAILLVFFLVPTSPRPPPTVVVLPAPQFVKNVDARKRRICTTGEYYDNDLEMCAPSIKTPIAFDATIMDTTKPACSSFYRNTCGKWINEHTNENRAFTFAYHKNQALIRNLVVNSSNTALNDFYHSCLLKNDHESNIELKHVLHVVTGNMRTHADLPTAFGRLARYGYTSPFILSIERHPVEPRMIPLFTYDNFEETLDEQNIYAMLNNARVALQYNVLDLQQRIQAIVKVVRFLREHMRQEDMMQNIVNYTQYVVDRFPRDVMRFDEMAPFDKWQLRGSHAPVNGWYNYFQALDGQGLRFHHDQEVWLIGRSYMQWLLTEGLNSFEMYEWRAYIEFSILYHSKQFEPQLQNNVYYKQHETRGPLGPGGVFFRKMRKSAQRSAPADLVQTCVRTTQHMLPGLVARAFLDKIQLVDQRRHEIRKDILSLVHSVKDTLVATLRENTWLPAADKQLLVNKMQKTLVRVAEPDEWAIEPFAGQLAADRYDHNMNLVRRYRVERNLALWHKDVPYGGFNQTAFSFFSIPLQDVNAYYSPSSNTITVLAGILQLPFYSTDFNRVSKYAILGSIIGHELSHALDSNGLYWDENGSFKPLGWLSSEAMRLFKQRTQCITNEFKEEMAAEGCNTTLNYGLSTLTENIADLTGITLAYKALGGSSNSLSDRQYFFLVLSQAFCESYDRQHRCDHVNHDVHAVADFRIDLTLRNIPDFASAFQCTGPESGKMYKSSSCAIY